MLSKVDNIPFLQLFFPLPEPHFWGFGKLECEVGGNKPNDPNVGGVEAIGDVGEALPKSGAWDIGAKLTKIDTLNGAA